MRKNRSKENFLWKRVLQSVLLGTIVGSILCFLCIVLATWGIVSSHKIPSFTWEIVFMSVLVSTFTAGFISGKRMGKRGLLVGTFCAAFTYAIHRMFWLIAGGSFWVEHTLPYFLLFLFAGAAGGYLSCIHKR